MTGQEVSTRRMVESLSTQVRSLAEASSGGVVIDASSLLFERSTDVTISPNAFGAYLTFETGPDGYSGSMQYLEVPTGLYHVQIEMGFALPLENRLITVYINSADSIMSTNGPYSLLSTASEQGQVILSSGLAIVHEGGSLSAYLATDALDAASPADLTMTYAVCTATKIG